MTTGLKTIAIWAVALVLERLDLQFDVDPGYGD